MSSIFGADNSESTKGRIGIAINRREKQILPMEDRAVFQTKGSLLGVGRINNYVSIPFFNILILYCLSFFFGGNKILIRVYHAAVVTLALLAAGCNEELPKGDPANSVSQGRFGLKVAGNVAIDADLQPRFMQFLVSGYQGVPAKTAKRVDIIPEMKSCNFIPPEAGAKIVFITAHETDNNDRDSGSNIHTFSEADIKNAAETFIKDWREIGREPRVSIGPYRSGLGVSNIVITETEAPVHLVLGSRSKVIYNLVVAPDARVSAISLIAADDSGLANVPKGAQISYIGPGLARSCNAIPHVRPTPHWQISRLAQRETNSREALNNLTALYSRFDTYFRNNFNQASEKHFISGERITHFLIGPPPSDLSKRVPFKSIAESTVLITRPENIITGNREDFRKALAEKVRPVAERMASGSLASLNRK